LQAEIWPYSHFFRALNEPVQTKLSLSFLSEKTMADFKKQVSENIPGEFFVDSTCIDCDTCRQLAPHTFGDSGRTSFVKTQPKNFEEIREATQALLACPTGSIGTLYPNRSSEVLKDFPMEIENGVYYCGFNSAKSYGGNSYFIRHPEGNWLIDSPKFLPHLVHQFEKLGGISTIFLTHQDDVADADKYAARFHSKRIIHEADLGAQPDAEEVLKGTDMISLNPNFKIIPTPGHTRGHIVLLYQNKYLFTGDHLWWRRKRKQLGASQGVAWYSWREQTESMMRLLNFDFEWVLPGHGERKYLPAVEMRLELGSLVNRMKASLETYPV
jgi:glyoxylase-like metal-dependent hydrolase (beta-lactamase superfamily II)/ferredoxin